MLAWLMAIFALVPETASLLFLGMENTTAALLYWLGFHALACIWLLAVSIKLVPTKFNHNKLKERLFFVLIPLLIPVVGMIGALLAVIPALHYPRKKQKQHFIDARKPLLPYKSADLEGRERLRPGALSNLLRSSGSMEERVKAVLATRYFHDPKAIQILREALKDTADDVRLLAYSILDQKETELREAIQKVLQQTEAMPEKKIPPLILKELAWLHWELVRMDLVQGGMVAELEKQAVNYAERVLESKPDTDMLLLKGNILMKQHQLEEAKACFLEAVDSGLSQSSVDIQLLEIAYLSRDFNEVTAIASELKRQKCHATRQARAIKHWSQTEKTELPELSPNAL